MPKRPTTPITLPGLGLATAWLNTSLATCEDDSRPVLYRTTLVEIYRTGVQLVATDSFMLLGAYTPTSTDDLTPPPGLDEKPDATYIVQDPDKRARALMAFVMTEAKAAEKEMRPFDVTLGVGSVEAPEVPTLDPTLDREGFTLETDSERLTLPIYAGEFPNWRALLARDTGDPTAAIDLSPTLLGRLGKLKGAPGAVRMDFDGNTNIVHLSCPGHEGYLFGGLMPIVGSEAA